ncbi:MAG: FG-GAP-like repeat-containing protein [Chloroflexi bacterium]|nr:FG-GAP-like repeat-containing protein [Chloroflexota bacterium]
MRHATLLWRLASLAALLLVSGAAPAGGAAAVQAPALKWQRGGCYSSWCETGWYSSPAAADLDGDGDVEVIGAAYSVVILDGASGALVRRMDPDAGRQWPSLALADLENDGDLEFVTAHGDGSLFVWNHLGDPVWSRQPIPGAELRSLGLYDLDADGNLEILTAATRSYDQWYVYEHNGDPRAGEWPQHSPDSDANGYTAGCYNQNLAAGDLDGDGRAEIVGPNDTHYLAAFQDDGAQVRANAMYGANPDGTLKVWSRVGVHVDHAVDLIGYADCGSEHRPNFAHSAPIIVDVNDDGVQEAVVVGNVYNCAGDYTSLYEIPYILNGDRTRWSGDGFDWTVLPTPDGDAAPLSEEWWVIENSHPNPAAADLDGDGNLEIIYPSYDGRMHAYWLDKSEHGNWPYAVYHASEGFFRFASEVTVADLDADGHAEVIFASWTQIHSGASGKLHILDYLGNPLHEVTLPSAFGGEDWNGALAAPTLANLDGDPDLEVVLNSANSGLIAYDLPGTANARLLWATGRGGYQRSGSFTQGDLGLSSKRVSPLAAQPGEAVEYTLTLRNFGAALPTVSLTDTLPAAFSLTGAPWASSGVVSETGGVITWQGGVQSGAPVTITYQGVLSGGSGQAVVNAVEINDGQGNLLQRQAIVLLDALLTYFPLIPSP